MTEAVAAQRSERMSWQQICEAYAGEWVLLVGVDWIDDISFEPRSAIVVSHGKHRQIGRARDVIPDETECAHFFIFKPGYQA